MAYKYFDVFTQIYTKSGIQEVVQDCNGYTVTNIGADTVTVDGKVLYPGTVGSILGDSFTVGGNEGEVYHKKTINIQFATTVNPQVEISQKYYVNNN